MEKGEFVKLSVTQENLAKALNVVGRAVNNRSSLPVLNNILIGADTNTLKLAATNLEIGIIYRLGCKTEQSGSLTIPARLFSEFITSLPGGNLDLSAEDLTLTVSTPHYQSQINGISAEEFPLIPEVSGEPILTMSGTVFRDALQQVVIAASLDETRPVLAGVYLYIDNKELVVVATDSYRLAEKRLKLPKASATELNVIVPARTMAELVRVLSDSEAELSIYLGESQIMFEIDGVELTSRLIDGQFPNYRQIIPEKIETAFEIGVEEFTRLTKVASLFARENAGGIRLEIKEEGQINLVSSASQVGENTSTAECQVTGPEAEIALNSRYLTDALGVIKSQTVEFGMSGKLNACLMRPTGEGASDDYLHLIMPLRT